MAAVFVDVAEIAGWASFRREFQAVMRADRLRKYQHDKKHWQSSNPHWMYGSVDCVRIAIPGTSAKRRGHTGLSQGGLLHCPTLHLWRCGRMYRSVCPAGDEDGKRAHPQSQSRRAADLLHVLFAQHGPCRNVLCGHPDLLPRSRSPLPGHVLGRPKPVPCRTPGRRDNGCTDCAAPVAARAASRLETRVVRAWPVVRCVTAPSRPSAAAGHAPLRYVQRNPRRLLALNPHRPPPT